MSVFLIMAIIAVATDLFVAGGLVYLVRKGNWDLVGAVMYGVYALGMTALYLLYGAAREGLI